MQMHPDYFVAKKRINALVNKLPDLRKPKWTIFVGSKWDVALEKDPTGQQCLRVVEDLEEIFTPMAN